MPEPQGELTRDLLADRQRLGAYKRNLRRYRRLLERRRVFFSSTQQQKGKETKRIFILSPDERPWFVFACTRWTQHQKRVFETNGDANWSALHRACAQGDRKRLQALLLDRRIRACTLTRSSCGRIPLHDAVVCERFSIIRLLLRQSDASLQVHARDNAQFTPMHYALTKLQALARSQNKPLPMPTGTLHTSNIIRQRYQKLWNVADQLLTLCPVGSRNSICDLDLLYRGDLWDVCRRGDSDRFQLLCKLFFPGPTGRQRLQELRLDILNRSLLHEAVSDRDHASPAIVYRLVSIYNVPRHIQDVSGCTVLHYAAMSGSKELCVLLLGDDGEEEFDPESGMLYQDSKGRTALHWSLMTLSTDRAARLQTASYLAQQCAASLFVFDYDGLTPLHLAIERGELELVQEFIALGANVNSSPSAFLNTSKNDQTRAYWAPCGQVFQRRSKERSIGSGSNEQHGGFGCRQFGGICQQCVLNSNSTDLLSKDRNTVRWISPLELAVLCAAYRIRYADSATLSAQSKRTIAIVETLLLNGADLNPDSQDGSDAPLSRAVGIGCEPLVSLLLFHGARHLSSRSVLLLCGSDRIHSDVKESILQSLAFEFNVLSTDLITRILPILFYRSCFATLTRLSREYFPRKHATDSVQVWSTLSQCAQQQLIGFNRAKWVALTLGHLEFLVFELNVPENQLKTEVRANIFRLLQYSLSLCLRQWGATLRRSVQCDSAQHDSRERVVLLSLRVFQDVEHAVPAQSVVTEWFELTIRLGLFQCALTLLQTYLIHHLLCLEMILRNYSIAQSRGLRFHSQFLGVCVEKSQELLGSHATEAPILLVSASTLVYACAFDVSAGCVKRLLWVYTKQSQQELAVLLKLRVKNKTMIEWIVARNCMEIAEDLWQISSQTSSTILPLMWRQFVATAIANASHVDQWLEWLLNQRKGLPDSESSSLDDDWSWMLQKALRCDSVGVLRYLVDRRLRGFQAQMNDTENGDVKSQDQANELLCIWFSDSFLLHEFARWNAVNVAKYALEHLSSHQFRAFWSSQSQQTHPENNCTPITLALLLGHVHMARCLWLELKIDSSNRRSVQDPADWPNANAHYGLFRSILMEKDRQKEPQPRKHCKADHMSSINGDWTAACALNQVAHLRAFVLYGLSVPTNDESVLFDLLLTSITNSAEDALAWLLDTHSPRILTHSSSQRIFEAASKHSSDVYARMTLLLLNSGCFHPGRLAGDGTEITLLHRAACFSNADLAKQIITKLLAFKGSDVNVLDAFGNTPLAYACYTGQLSNVCFLTTLPAARLEAEYEGQSCFYYTLHLLPSFAWRWIVQSVLVRKRNHVFLHCNASYENGRGTCACKGFEQREVGELELEEVVNASENGFICGFCGHSVEQHSEIPYPSWFADQYDSYRGVVSAETSRVEREDDGSDYESDLVGQQEPMETPEAVENTCGRLNLDMLRRVAALKYPSIMEAFYLQIDAEMQSQDNMFEESVIDINEEPVAAWPMVSPLEEMTPSPSSVTHESDSDQSSDEDDTCGSASYASSPWFMRNDLAKLHPLNCDCHRANSVSTDNTWKFSVVSVWLRQAALMTFAGDLRSAFRRWRFELLSDKSCPKQTTGIRSLPSSSLSQRCLIQWRYGPEMAAFRCWKRWGTSNQIDQHHVEEKADGMTTQMRRIRLQSLRHRQIELQRTISALNISSIKNN